MNVIVFALAMIFLLVAFLCYDYINRFQYENYRDLWDAAGKPRGFLWNAPETTYFASWVSMLLTWIFFNEEWMSHEPQVRKAMIVMRICVVTFWLSMIPFLYFGS